MTVRISVLSIALAASTRSAQQVRIVDDQRAEVIGILFRIAGASDFRDGNVEPYIRQVDSAFAATRNDAVFTELNRLRRTYHISLSDVTSLAPQLSDPLSFRERAPIDGPRSTLASTWHGAEARTFLSDARAWAAAAQLGAFLRANRTVYDSAAARMQHLVDARGHLDWFAKFFGEQAGDVLIVSPLLITSRGNFGADFFDGPIHERYSFLAVTGSDANGFPVLGPETLPTLIHELNHSYVNHVLDSVSGQLVHAGDQIFPLVKSEMSALAYTKPQIMFNESIVRAAVIRYLAATTSSAAARTEMQTQRALGFVWIDELADLLADYEAHRERYPTFSSFTGRIIAYYDTPAPRLPAMRDTFERDRPRIIKTSIVGDAHDVDPRLTQLVVTFDQPVTTTVVFKGRCGADIPELTGGAFDATRTVLTIGIQLESGRSYQVPFRPGFFSDNGVPNQKLDLRFHTRALPQR